MVVKEPAGTISANRFLIRPNCSMSWDNTIRFYLGMVFVSFTIAILFAFNGAWPILPFAGLEMLVLGAALYEVARRCAYWQIVEIDEDRINIFDSLEDSHVPVTLQRAWAHIVLERPENSWYLPRILVRSHGQVVEIGHCLTGAEREQLALDLKSALRS